MILLEFWSLNIKNWQFIAPSAGVFALIYYIYIYIFRPWLIVFGPDTNIDKE